MVGIDREVMIFDQDFACLEVHRFGVEGRMDDAEGTCRIRQRAIGGRLRVDDLGILNHERSCFSAPPQATTWSSTVPTDFSCWGAGLNVVKFSKSVIIESNTCARTVATCTSARTSRSCSTALAPPAPPSLTKPAAWWFHSANRKS